MAEKHTPDETQKTVRAKRLEILKRSALQRARFQDLVMKVISELPQAFQQRLENVDVVVADWPSPIQLARNNLKSRYSLLGLYEGVPRTRRGQGYGMVLPDKITIFRKPIETRCRSWEEIEKEVAKVVRHEIAHHFGIEEHRLQNLENNGLDKDGRGL
jgi:predicted Zn-dependent protease with MMP-like domain